jgi:nitroreductase
LRKAIFSGQKVFTMHLPPSLSAAQASALNFLFSRRSPWPLTHPVPSDAELSLVFHAAMRAPDHLGLRPWRFSVVREDGQAALGEVFAKAALERDPNSSPAGYRAQASAAPMIITVGAHVSYAVDVPEIEQLLSSGAAAMNILNALHVLGYGAYWATGANTYENSVKEALGLDNFADQLLGFIYVGTPVSEPGPITRPNPGAFVKQWHEV